jgi:hypothetical protein
MALVELARFYNPFEASVVRSRSTPTGSTPSYSTRR